MKNKHTLFLILAILITSFEAALYVFMYYRISVALDRTIQSRITADSLVASKNKEQGSLQDYKTAFSKWSILPSFFVDSGQVVNFIEAVESIGPESGSSVSISSIDADDLDHSPVGTEGSIRIHITTQGSWSSVMKALSLAEALPYKTFIKEVKASSEKIGKTGSSSAKTVWNLSFDMEVAMVSGATNLIQ